MVSYFSASSCSPFISMCHRTGGVWPRAWAPQQTDHPHKYSFPCVSCWHGGPHSVCRRRAGCLWRPTETAHVVYGRGKVTGCGPVALCTTTAFGPDTMCTVCGRYYCGWTVIGCCAVLGRMSAAVATMRLLRQGPRGTRGPTPRCSGQCGKRSWVYLAESHERKGRNRWTAYSFL